jgi:hypothetical protein
LPRRIPCDFEPLGGSVRTGLPGVEAGEEGTLVVMTVSGVPKAPGEDEGKHVEAAYTHSEVAVDSVPEVADTGEPLLPQLVTSSTVEKVPPLNLAALQPASPPTIRLTSPPGSSHSSDKSAHEGTDHGTSSSVSPPDTSTKAQGHSSAGEISIFTTPGEVPPISMTKVATTVDTRLQSVETQALAVNERITSVEKVGETTQRQAAAT